MWPPRLNAHIFCLHIQFKTPQPMIFGTLQRRFNLNTSVSSKFIKFIRQSGATWRKLITLIILSTNAKGS